MRQAHFISLHTHNYTRTNNKMRGENRTVSFSLSQNKLKASDLPSPLQLRNYQPLSFLPPSFSSSAELRQQILRDSPVPPKVRNVPPNCN